MTIGTRLTLGLALLLALTAVLGAVSLEMQRRLDGLADQLYTHPFAVSNAALEARADLTSMRLAMVELGLSKDPAAITRTRAAVIEMDRRIDTNLAITATFYLGDPGEVALVQALVNQWRRVRARVFQLKEAGGDAQVLATITGEGAKAFAEVDATMAGVVRFARDKAAFFRAQAERTLELFRRVTLVLLGLCLATGMLIAYLTVRAIRPPLRTLGAYMDDLAKGREGPEVPYQDRTDEIGDMARAVAVLREHIRFRQRAEAALVQAKAAAEAASRAKSAFLANMSHELRTPLNAVIGFSEAILSKAFVHGVDQRCRGYVADIRDSGLHLLSLISDVLDLSRVEAGGDVGLEDEAVDLAEVATEAMALVEVKAEKSGITLETALPATLPALRADRLRVKQILLNLLSNAVKFTLAGGVVRIEANLEDDGALALVVADTGIGMRAEDIATALSPFGQIAGTMARRHQGTGLGLPLTHRLVELHGGSLTLTSLPHRGTTVTVRFPAERVGTTPIQDAARFIT